MFIWYRLVCLVLVLLKYLSNTKFPRLIYIATYCIMHVSKLCKRDIVRVQTGRAVHVQFINLYL